MNSEMQPVLYQSLLSPHDSDTIPERRMEEAKTFGSFIFSGELLDYNFGLIKFVKVPAGLRKS